MIEQCKIIPFKETDTNTLSDDDIFHLLMGVIKMVQKYATTEQIVRLLEKLENQ